ncbi:MAG: antitoxin HicB, partial [Candidatus Hydrogenedentes bacterium]|nr:antitoxin HicB [Candidatus Hydrogenedentota bacterium]
ISPVSMHNRGEGRRAMTQLCKVPLVLSPQAEGGYTVTSPVVPELVTEGDTIEEAVANVRDALRAALELYEDMGRTLPGHTVNGSQSPAGER